MPHQTTMPRLRPLPRRTTRHLGRPLRTRTPQPVHPATQNQRTPPKHMATKNLIDGINRRYLTQARQRAQNEAWAWRYHSHTPQPGWQQHAACRGLDPNLFYSENNTTAKIPTAINRICDGCPVRVDCGAAASIEENVLDLNVIHGVRAGMAATTRANMYRLMTRHGIRQPT